MVGYDLDHKAYRLYHPPYNKIFVATNVTFDETLFPLSNMSVNDEVNGQSNSLLSHTTSDHNTFPPSPSNEFSESDESFSSSFTNGFQVPLTNTDNNDTTYRELQSSDITNMSLGQSNPNSRGSLSPVAQTHSPISTSGMESSTIASAHPPQTDYLPTTSDQNVIDRSPIQTRFKIADSISILHKEANLDTASSPLRNTSTGRL